MSRFTPLVLLPCLLLIAACDERGGPGSPEPTLLVEAPVEGREYWTADPVPLRAVVDDDLDAPDTLVVTWTLDGEVVAEETADNRGVAESELTGLTAGTYRLGTAVVDSEGNLTSDAMDLVVRRTNTLPTCEVVSPEFGGLVASGISNLFSGTAADAEDGPEDLEVAIEMLEMRLAIGRVEADGTWEIPVSGLDIGSRRLTVVVTDSDGGECRDDVTVSVSTAPEVAITSPLGGETVNGGVGLQLRGTATDYQDAEFALQAMWVSDVDGELGPSTPSSVGDVLLEGADLSPGPHRITLRVTDSDGLTGIAGVNISANAAPSTPVIRMSPAEPTAGATLSVFVDEPSIDPEGGEITYTWRWSKNGTAQPFFDDSSVPPTQLSRGQVWSVELVAVDPAGGQSPPAVATATIFNGLPTTSTPTVWPPSPRSDEVLYCVEGATSDPEGDPTSVSFTWEADGVHLGTGTALSAGAAARGQTVVCIGTPWDGISYGPTQSSAAVVILNSAPSTPVPVVTPAAPGVNDDLVCSIAVPSTDFDNDPVTYSFSWSVDGAPATSSGATVSSLVTDYGDGWLCQATPSDGTLSGVPGTVAVTIGSGTPQLLDVGTEASVYSGGNTRGFWFEAPVSMTLTGLRVPTTLVGVQNVEVVRFTAGAPVEYPASTTEFDSLFVALDVAGGDFIVVDIGIAEGDTIGILGGRGTTPLEASYGAVTPAAFFDGIGATLTRLVYQGNLNVTGGAVAISSEVAGAIGRVEVEYSVP